MSVKGNAPDDPDAMPEVPANISTYNFVPNPPVLNTELDTTSLWGNPLAGLLHVLSDR